MRRSPAVLPADHGQQLRAGQEAAPHRELAERLGLGALAPAPLQQVGDVALAEQPQVDGQAADGRALPSLPRHRGHVVLPADAPRVVEELGEAEPAARQPRARPLGRRRRRWRWRPRRGPGRLGRPPRRWRGAAVEVAGRGRPAAARGVTTGPRPGARAAARPCVPVRRTTPAGRRPRSPRGTRAAASASLLPSTAARSGCVSSTRRCQAARSSVRQAGPWTAAAKPGPKMTVPASTSSSQLTSRSANSAPERPAPISAGI